MGKPTLAHIARTYLLERGETSIHCGCWGYMDEIYALSGGRIVHPLNRHKAVIDACRRSTLFRRAGYIRFTDHMGRREILHPVFEICQ